MAKKFEKKLTAFFNLLKKVQCFLYLADIFFQLDTVSQNIHWSLKNTVLPNKCKDISDVFFRPFLFYRNYTVIMNPSDINCIARCKNLNQNPIIGDFVTRMFGQEHSFHNQEKPVHEDISSFRERNKAVPRAIKDNLRGPSQVENLYQSCVQNTVKIIKQMKEGKIHSFQENNTVSKL